MTLERSRRGLAKERWMMLKNVLLDKRPPPLPSRSSRLFNRLPLFDVQALPGLAQSKSSTWLQYSICENVPGNVLVKIPTSELSTEDLLVYDNTGNICIWASEQVLAYYCMKNIQLFAGKTVVEIGGGFSCLAGCFVSKYGSPRQVYLSDGNEKALTNVADIVAANCLEKTKVVQLCWGDISTYSHLSGEIDFLLCADCLFEESKREHLALTIFKLLKPDGEALIFAPKRGGTFDDFVSHSKSFFGNVSVVSDYDEKMWMFNNSKLDCSSYNEDTHYPILLKLKRSEKVEAIVSPAHYA